MQRNRKRNSACLTSCFYVTATFATFGDSSRLESRVVIVVDVTSNSLRYSPAAAAAAASSLTRSVRASTILLHLARLFWNQIFTWVSVRWRVAAYSARSAGDRYGWRWNVRSRQTSWSALNGVRGLRSALWRRSRVVQLRSAAGDDLSPATDDDSSSMSHICRSTALVSNVLQSGMEISWAYASAEATDAAKL